MPIPVIRVAFGKSIGVYEPGNGTRYVAVAIPWRGDINMAALGEVTDGWLLVAGNGRAYCFQSKGFLTDDYVEEKLGGKGYNECDIPHLAHLIRTLLGRPNLRPLIQDMPDDPEFYYNERAERMP